MGLNQMMKIAVVFALSTLSCSRSVVAATTTTATEFRKHGMKDDAASRDMESLLLMQENLDQELPNNNGILIKPQKQSQTNHWTVQEKNSNDRMVRPTERARRKGFTVTNSNEGYTYVPIDKFAMVVTSTKTTTKSSMVDLDTLRDALVTSLDHHFRMSNYSDKYIIYDSVTLASVSIQEVPTSDRRGRQLLVNEEQNFYILVEGGVALFQTFLSTPSYEKIQTIVKTSIGSDDLIQKMKTSNLFPDLTSIQSIDNPSSIQTPSPLPDTTTPPTVSPTTTSPTTASPTTTTTTTKNTSPTKRNPNQIQSSSQYSSSSSSPDSSTFAVVLSIVCISIGVLVVSIALFVKKRRYDRKEWCTDNFNHQHDLNLASMDSQPVYNTGVVSLGEQSYIDNDIYTDQQRRKYPTTTTTTTIPATSSSGDNNHTNSAFRDNLLEMTRNLFVNFGSDKSTDSKSRDHTSLEPTLPSLFDEEKWKNMHQPKKKTTTTKTEPSSSDANATVSTVDVDDLESPSPSPVKRYNTIAKPIPLNKRMRSTSSTSTMSENHIDLEPDTAWDPNDNDADSDVASIDAQFMIT